MKVYYLKHERFLPGDTMRALRYALDLARQDGDIKTITLLVLQQHQYQPFLSEVGFKPIHFKNHFAIISGYKVQIHTVKTYQPNYQFANHPQSEILVAVGLPSKELERFEDFSNIKYWIIVPWLLEENKEWLSIFEAEDMDTGELVALPAIADKRISNAIKWLNDTSYPNEGYHHPLDEDRLHQMANALKHYNVPFNYASTVRCAMENGQIPSAARKTADAFQRAQTRALIRRFDSYGLRFLKRMMEGEVFDDD